MTEPDSIIMFQVKLFKVFSKELVLMIIEYMKIYYLILSFNLQNDGLYELSNEYQIRVLPLAYCK